MSTVRDLLLTALAALLAVVFIAACAALYVEWEVIQRALGF